MEHWNLDITGYCAVGAGCLIEKELELSHSTPYCSKDF